MKINRRTAIIITFFFGGLGVHRFVAGKIGTGIIWLLTGGCFGVGSIIDFVMICMGKFRGKNGEVLWESDRYNSLDAKIDNWKTIKNIRKKESNNASKNDVIILVCILAVLVLFLGFHFGEPEGGFLSGIKSVAYQFLKKEIDVAEFEGKTIEDFMKKSPYKVTEDESGVLMYSDKEMSLMIESEQNNDGLDMIYVSGNAPFISVYGIKTGMAKEEINQIAEDNDLIVIGNMDQDVYLEPQNSSTLIVVKMNQNCCENWMISYGSSISFEEKEACIQTVKDSMLLSNKTVSVEDAIMTIFGDGGRWICSSGLGQMNLGDGSNVIIYENGEHYIHWSIGKYENVMGVDACVAGEYWDEVVGFHRALYDTTIELGYKEELNYIQSTEENNILSNDEEEQNQIEPDFTYYDCSNYDYDDYYYVPCYSVDEAKDAVDFMYGTWYLWEGEWPRVEIDGQEIDGKKYYVKAVFYPRISGPNKVIYSFEDDLSVDHCMTVDFDYVSTAIYPQGQINYLYDAVLGENSYTTKKKYCSVSNDTFSQIYDECADQLYNYSYWLDGTTVGITAKNQYYTSGSEQSISDVIVGIWHNGYTDWATNYHTVFYEDGYVEHFGYRNYDDGYYWIEDEDTVGAQFYQYCDFPGEGYVVTGMYECYYYYNSETGFLERQIIEGDEYEIDNDGDGLIWKVNDYVENSY